MSDGMTGTRSGLVSLAEIRDAARRLERVAVRTPLIPVAGLEPPLLVKPESLQPTGSFKLRGAYTAITASEQAARQRGVIAHSSGNHGHAVAYAAALLGVRAVVVVPRTAPKVKTDAPIEVLRGLLELGVTSGADVGGAAGRYRSTSWWPGTGTCSSRRSTHRAVIAQAGARSALEIVADCPQVGLVLVPVSGGGLISGIAAAVRASRPAAAVVGVEPELAADARESFRRGERVSWPAADVQRTIADALRVEQVGALPFAHIRELVADIITVTEDEMLAAVRLLASQARLVAEPGGAAAVAAWLYHRDELPGATTPVAVLSGGNIDPKLLASILAPDSGGPDSG